MLVRQTLAENPGAAESMLRGAARSAFRFAIRRARLGSGRVCRRSR